MKLDGASVVVVGVARSGVAAVELLREHGAVVRAVDQKPEPIEGIEVAPQSEQAFEGADLIVLSPGVPTDIAELRGARARGVKIIGDLELASWFLQGEIIGITGSNGKTTTTALTGHILKESGIAAQVGGNIGTPPASLVAASRADQFNVLELSSFQLETTETFRAHIGAALNVTPDHLDRHYTMENYAEAKARLFVNQRESDFAVLNHDDAITRGYAARTKGKAVWFSSTHEVSPGAYLDGARILLDGEPLMQASEAPIRGMHNLENIMAAAAMAKLAGASHESIRAAVMTFPGVEHRLEFVRERNGVAWYNDSKATNVDATLKAIAAFPGGLWIILGGKDKNSDYTPLAAPLKEKAHAALLIGSAAEKIRAQLSKESNGEIRMIACRTLEAAVEEARARAVSGDTVLLAPACASFDQFQNYEHRGREFKRLVGELQWQN
ncbi:MAG TPA: UDP-N-acetylmuramoyl-L-alanine--D-glutamate ligase [Bryobacteraceae bacterium]|nr:UDP-N-acetylmuramoyl-L-alanine--D-glutamate ligase [Bryobacteraceae bacterium]